MCNNSNETKKVETDNRIYQKRNKNELNERNSRGEVRDRERVKF